MHPGGEEPGRRAQGGIPVAGPIRILSESYDRPKVKLSQQLKRTRSHHHRCPKQPPSCSQSGVSSAAGKTRTLRRPRAAKPPTPAEPAGGSASLHRGRFSASAWGITASSGRSCRQPWRKGRRRECGRQAHHQAISGSALSPSMCTGRRQTWSPLRLVKYRRLSDFFRAWPSAQKA